MVKGLDEAEFRGQLGIQGLHLTYYIGDRGFCKDYNMGLPTRA